MGLNSHLFFNRAKTILNLTLLCNLYNNDKIGDEFHYIFRCSYYSVKRKRFIGFSKGMHANTSDFGNIMCEEDVNILTTFCVFVNIFMKHVCRPPGYSLFDVYIAHYILVTIVIAKSIKMSVFYKYIHYSLVFQILCIGYYYIVPHISYIF